ncbi:hypothetical protein BV87_03830 [Sphingobium yanoikuyae]|uniref:Uncharacterized protein n=1 Tax=Sphingobium yanoikuyae TaxID=13690 RepID=A0A0J9CWI5_SPHYA|nr:hypothetical protein BV87_03830 [Sphingobium yanoikuyae]KMW28701.1 hypothetical protein BV87_19210 [Sphingobium yanoikuyae]
MFVIFYVVIFPIIIIAFAASEIVALVEVAYLRIACFFFSCFPGSGVYDGKTNIFVLRIKFIIRNYIVAGRLVPDNPILSAISIKMNPIESVKFENIVGNNILSRSINSDYFSGRLNV